MAVQVLLVEDAEILLELLPVGERGRCADTVSHTSKSGVGRGSNCKCCCRVGAHWHGLLVPPGDQPEPVSALGCKSKVFEEVMLDFTRIFYSKAF